MADRTRSARSIAPVTDPPPGAADVRRVLEGRVEQVEAGLLRYDALEKQLSGPGWKKRLRANPLPLREVRLHEPALTEALERIRRRAELEGWSERLPGLHVLSESHLRSAALQRRVQQRL